MDSGPQPTQNVPLILHEEQIMSCVHGNIEKMQECIQVDSTDVTEKYVLNGKVTERNLTSDYYDIFQDEIEHHGTNGLCELRARFETKMFEDFEVTAKGLHRKDMEEIVEIAIASNLSHHQWEVCAMRDLEVHEINRLTVSLSAIESKIEFSNFVRSTIERSSLRAVNVAKNSWKPNDNRKRRIEINADIPEFLRWPVEKKLSAANGSMETSQNSPPLCESLYIHFNENEATFFSDLQYVVSYLKSTFIFNMTRSERETLEFFKFSGHELTGPKLSESIFVRSTIKEIKKIPVHSRYCALCPEIVDALYLHSSPEKMKIVAYASTLLCSCLERYARRNTPSIGVLVRWRLLAKGKVIPGVFSGDEERP